MDKTEKGCNLALHPSNADRNQKLKTMAGVTIGSLMSQVCDFYFIFCFILLRLFHVLLEAFYECGNLHIPISNTDHSTPLTY